MMRRKPVILCIVALVMSACGTANVAPLDDAYYWPDKSAHATHSDPTESGTSSPSNASSASSPSIEYTNVQDTTVTIKIKR